MQVRKVRPRNSSSSCPKCESNAVGTFNYSDTVDFRQLELDVDELEGSKCASCGTRWSTSAQTLRNQALIKEEYARVRDRVRTRDGLLSGNRFSEIRKHLSINQREASLLFGGGTNSFNKYESGEVLQSFAMDRLIRLTGAIGQRAVDFLRDVEAENPFLMDFTAMYVKLYTKALASYSAQKTDEEDSEQPFQSSSATRQLSAHQTEQTWQTQQHLH